MEDQDVVFHQVFSDQAGRQMRQWIARILPLDQAAHAHELGESGHAPGKMILILDGTDDG